MLHHLQSILSLATPVLYRPLSMSRSCARIPNRVSAIRKALLLILLYTHTQYYIVNNKQIIKKILKFFITP
jgi:hypothetical protein